MNVIKKNRGRFATALAVLATALVIAGCGGGGGGSSTPPPTTVTQTVTCPDGTSQSATAATAALAIDAATAACPGINVAKVTVTPADKATGVSPDTIATNGIVVATSSTLATPAISDITLKAGTTSVPVTVTMTVGGKGFKFTPVAKLLYAQVHSGIVNLTDTLGKKLAVPFSFTTASVSCTSPLVPDSAGTTCVPPTCPTGTAWNGAICATTVLHYTDKVFAIWTGKQIFAVTRTSVTLVTNKTQYTTGGWPLAACWMAPPSVSILADGQILHTCQDAVSLRRHYLALNPITNEQTEYAGPVPAILQCTENADKSWTCQANSPWVSYQETAPVGAPAGSATAAQVSYGWYFLDDLTRKNLQLLEAGVTTTVKLATEVLTDFINGQLYAIFGYSNP